MLYDKDDWNVIDPATVKVGDIIWVIKVHPVPNIAWIITIKVFENSFGSHTYPVLYGNVLKVEQQDATRPSKIRETDTYRTRYGNAANEYEYIDKFGIKVFAECPAHLRVLYEIQ